MDITVKEKLVPSSDGAHVLHGRVYSPDPSVSIRGIFQTVHGMTEHIRRYDTFMRRIAEEGFICFGYDHLGHGYTAADENELGFFAHKDGWLRLVKDVTVFADSVRNEYGKDLPYYLLGHSMGSFVVRCSAEKTANTDESPEKLIVMGTGGPNLLSGPGLAFIKLVKLFYGERHISPIVYELAFGNYNKRFKSDGDGSKYEWLTRDASVKKDYASDPLCTFQFTASAMSDLLMLQRRCNRKEWFSSIKIPVLLLSGSDDPVGDYGRGVICAYDRLIGAGVDARMRLFEGGRHEILNDSCFEDAVEEILNFVK